MIKNYFTHDQVSKLKSLVGQKLDGFYLSAGLFPYSNIYHLLVATDQQVIRFATETATESIEGSEYEENNYWVVESASEISSDVALSFKTDWFQGELIADIKVVRSRYTKVLGQGTGVVYEVDTSIVFYLESGIITLHMKGIDYVCDLRLSKFDGFEGYDVPVSDGFIINDSEDEVAYIEYFEVSTSLLSLAEVERDAPNFIRGLQRVYYSYASNLDLFALHSMIGKTIDKMQIFIQPNLGTQVGFRLESEGLGIDLITFERTRYFLEGPWNGGQHFSEIEVMADSYSEEVRSSYSGKDNFTRNDVEAFPYKNQKLLGVDVVDETVSGDFFNQKYRLVCDSKDAPLGQIQQLIESEKWEYGTCIAVIFHFETGAMLVSKTCIHNLQIQIKYVENAQVTTIDALKARFADLKVAINSDTRRVFKMSAGPWAGAGESIDLQWESDAAKLAKGCTLKCYEQDAVAEPVTQN